MMGETVLEAGAVRVPGSTSNLGAGFDCLGLAVDRWLAASFEPDPHAVGNGRLELRREGTLSTLAEPPRRDLLVRAFVAALGREPAGVLTARSEIPIGKGLGSSAAALVAGAALADVVQGRPSDAGAAFQAACEVEEHGDNAGPSAFGGLVAVVQDGGRSRALRLALSPAIGFGFVAPARELSTLEARARLPVQVSHRVAVRSVSRVVALIQGLATGDPGLLRTGLADELHVPHRSPLVPGADEAVEAAVVAGAWGGTLSGAGSGLLIVGPPERTARAVDAAAEVLRRLDSNGGSNVLAWTLRPPSTGILAGPAGDLALPGASPRP
jgi:homoserine kinase